jgi:hypothetical protein
VDIHAGSLQRAPGVFDTGEPDDAKVSSPVRWGADGKGLQHRTSPAAHPTLDSIGSFRVPAVDCEHGSQQCSEKADPGVLWGAHQEGAIK